MSDYALHTTNPVPESFELAGWWRRVWATMVDELIMMVVTIALAGVIYALLFAVDQTAAIVVATIIAVIAFLLLQIFYAPLLLKRSGKQNGQTFGKQVAGIRVVRDGGEAYDLGSAMIRETLIKWLVFGLLGSALGNVPTLVDYLWPLWDGENRSLHDMMASSHVVRVQPPVVQGL